MRRAHRENTRPFWRGIVTWAVLVVLPSTSLGWLGFSNLERAREERLTSQRRMAESALEAVGSDLRRQVDLRLDIERERPFYEYSATYRPREGISAFANYVVNPLVGEAEPSVRARFQVAMKPGEPAALDESAFDILTSIPDCRQAVLLTWRKEIETSAWYPEEPQELAWQMRCAWNAKEPEPPPFSTCVMMPLEVVASNRLRPELEERVLRAQAGVPADNVFLNNAEQAWRSGSQGSPPAQVSTFQTDLVSMVRADAQLGASLLAMRAVRLPNIDGNQYIGAMGEERLLQGLVLDLNELIEASLEPVRPYLASEGVSLESVVALPEEERLARPFGELLGSSLPTGTLTAPGIIAHLDPAAIESALATRRGDLMLLLGLLAVAMSIASYLAFRSLNREWALLERQRGFVSAVTHELRTPVAGIRLYADMLEQDWVEDEDQRRRFFSTLRGETDRLEKMVDDILDLAAFDRGEPRVLPKLVEQEVSPLVIDVVESFRAAPRKREIELELVPQATGRAKLDLESLRRILFNLLENAVKYTPAERTPKIGVETSDDSRFVRIDVRDNACGLDPKDLDRIFDDFYRSGSEERRQAPGAGLGLGVVRRHVEALGGTVEALCANGADGGSIFRVRFPRL